MEFVTSFMRSIAAQVRRWISMVRVKNANAITVDAAPSIVESDPEIPAKITLFPQIASATTPTGAVTPRLSPYLFAARLRSVAVLNARKGCKPCGARASGRANLKAKPRVLMAKKPQRRPPLFATKAKPGTAKRATNRLWFAVNVKRTAQIIKFPTNTPAVAVPRLRRAA